VAGLDPDFADNDLQEGYLAMDQLMANSTAELHACTHSHRKNRGSTHKLRVMELRRENPDVDMAELNGRVVLSQCGCTAVAAVIHEKRLAVANSGDAQAVLARGCTSEGARAYDLSRPHSLADEAEVARVINAGYEVEGDPPRINCELAVARSIGDLRFKQVKGLSPEQQPVSVVPEIMETEITDGDDFLVVACDGIFEVMGTQDVVDFIHTGLTAGTPATEVMQNLLDACIAPSMPSRLGGDNMTAMVVFLKR